jgi:hypothetical protein
MSKTKFSVHRAARGNSDAIGRAVTVNRARGESAVNFGGETNQANQPISFALSWDLY